MQASDAGIALIKEFEGFAAKSYVCPAGKNTIGYGHVIQPGELFDTIDEAKAIELLRGDLRHAEKAVTELVKVPLDQNQFDALASFTYNLGVQSLKESTLLTLLNSGNYDGAARQFSRWVYAGNRRLDGLVRRRQAERDLFMRPVGSG